jgi:hypothetical protein
MAAISHTWSELGPVARIGDVKLLEGGRYVVNGIEKTATPKRWCEVHCPGQGFMNFEYDNGRWYGCRLRVGPEWQVTEGAFEGYMATLDLRDIEVSEIYRSQAEEHPGGMVGYLVSGLLYVVVGVLLYSFFGYGLLSFILVALGSFSVVNGLGLARIIKHKYVRLTTEEGVFEIKASKCDKMLLDRLRELECERVAGALSDQHTLACAS